jgi:tetratricopeptide (TPR) repeat protein
MKPIAFATAVGLLLSSPVLAFQPGDLVAVVKTAPIKSGGKIVGNVAAGNTLVVGRVGDEGLWVNFKAAGWIDPANVVPLDEAGKHFGGRLQANRDDAEAHYGHARALMAKEQWTAAMEHLNEAARIEPRRAEFFVTRGHVLTRQRRYDEALADFDYAVKLDPLNAQAYRLRAGVNVEREKYADAISDYNVAARLFPNDGALNNDRAWLLATCPDATFRNGEQAVRDATLACESCAWQVYNRLGTLAAAYAEKGDFEEAVKWQQKCLEIAPANRKQAQQNRLRLYQAAKPYREFAGVWK